MAKSKGTGRGRRPQKHPPLNVILTGVPTRDYEQLEAEAIDALAEGLADLFIAKARAEVAAELGIEVSALPYRPAPFAPERDLLASDGLDGRRRPRSARAAHTPVVQPPARRSEDHGRPVEDRREVSTEEAADILNLSHPHLLRLIESGALPFTMVGGQQRVLFAEVLAYKRSRSARRGTAFRELADEAQEHDLDR